MALLDRGAISLSMLELAYFPAVVAHAVEFESDTDNEKEEYEAHQDGGDGRVAVVSIVEGALEDCSASVTSIRYMKPLRYMARFRDMTHLASVSLSTGRSSGTQKASCAADPWRRI